MSLATLHSIWTVLLVILFIGIVIWAWSGRSKQSFEEASRLPLEDEDPSTAFVPGEKRHG
jgi:cytochrome c oxidase cbb3-type subunit 4